MADLGSADDGSERTLRLADGALQVVELLLEKEAGNGRREELGDTSSGGVSAVSSSEGIVYIHVEGSSKLLGEVLVVLLLLRVEANILKKAVLAILEVVDDTRGLLANAILGHSAGLGKELSKASTAGSERVLVLRTALGAAKMGRDCDTGAVVEEVLDGRHRGTDAGVIGNLLSIQRNVEVAADQNLQNCAVRSCDKKGKCS